MMENAYNEPYLETKPTTSVYRPLRGHLSRVRLSVYVTCRLHKYTSISMCKNIHVHSMCKNIHATN